VLKSEAELVRARLHAAYAMHASQLERRLKTRRGQQLCATHDFGIQSQSTTQVYMLTVKATNNLFPQGYPTSSSSNAISEHKLHFFFNAAGKKNVTCSRSPPILIPCSASACELDSYCNNG